MGTARTPRRVRRAGGSATRDREAHRGRGGQRVARPLVERGGGARGPPRASVPDPARRRGRRPGDVRIVPPSGGSGDARGDRGRRGDPRIDLRLRSPAGARRAPGARWREADPDRGGPARRAGRCVGAPRVEGDGPPDRGYARSLPAGAPGRRRVDHVRITPASDPAAPARGTSASSVASRSARRERPRTSARAMPCCPPSC